MDEVRLDQYVQRALGFWEWVDEITGREYHYVVAGRLAAMVWHVPGNRWDDERAQWMVAWPGRSYWDMPLTPRPQTQADALRLAEEGVAHPEQFMTPRERLAQRAAG